MKTQILTLQLMAVLLLGSYKSGAQRLIGDMDAVVTLYSADSISPVAMVKRIGDPIGAGAPFAINGNFTDNWVPPSISPAITSWTAKNMGQIFGTTIDAIGNVYFGATAMYFPSPYPYPNAERMAYSTVSPATIAQDAFHSVGGEIGLIYEAAASSLNSVTCIVTAATTSAAAGIGTTKMFNTGYGIGNVTFSKTYNKLYASNLEDGKLYGIDPATGIIQFIFDPLGADNGTSGIAPLGERVFGIAINTEYDGSTRLYYSVLMSNSTSNCQSIIRSVQLTAGGDFLPSTDMLEITLPISYQNTYISDIAFSIRGELLVAEKGDPHNAHVYQYYGRHSAWSVPQDLPVSTYSIFRNSGGGVTYGSMKMNGSTICDSLIWTMENAMSGITIYGLQSIPRNGYAPFPAVSPFFGNQTHVVDLDQVSGAAVKGRFGDVVFYDSSCVSSPTDICGLVSAQIVKSDSGSCCYNIYLSNKYYGQYFTGVSIEAGHLNIDNVTAGPVWGGITYRSDQAVSFGDTAKLWYMPQDSAGSSGFLLAKICVSGSGNDVLKIRWIGNEPQFDTVCEKDVPIAGCSVPVDTNCVGVIGQKAICSNGVVTLQFQIKNNSAFTMRSVTLHSINPDVVPVSSFFPIADLLPGNTSPVYTIQLKVTNGATSGCFFFSACDLHIFPGTSGQYPKYCCMDSIQYCVSIPHCDSCDAINVTATKMDSVNCCYFLSLANYYVDGSIKCIRFRGAGGAQFALLSGWNIQSPVSSNDITICAPGGVVNNGISSNFASFCITGASEPPYLISVDFIGDKGQVVCGKAIQFDNCKPVVPTCATIVDDSLYCDGSRTLFSFNVKNNSPFKLYQFDMRLSDTSFKLDKYFIVPNPPIPVGATAGPYVITVDSSLPAIENFCLYLTGHNNVYTDSTAATECCTDSMAVACVPMMSCAAGEQCCQFSKLSIPNGITPNNDGIDDNFVIGNSAICTNINLKVYNRWGNIVFKQDHYNNTWGGKNSGGQLLPQGTYFVVLKLATGDEKAFYVDIRY